MIIFLIILLFFQSFVPSYGINEFTTNQEISYQFNQQGISQVEHKININIFNVVELTLFKSIWGIPWNKWPMKDVIGCDKLRGDAE